ncbi:MAG: UDP-glucose 4-epimerase GalE [Deltaproteobacteria bacterium]|jgi:UDP-glucose 4-epimerase|nr:UDP-glucose 4-epimerase GalE [Deltaproteobacteria bacterium]
MKKTILVVGGAGYIGSHAAMALDNVGYDALVFDNLSTGHREFLRFGRHVIGDLADRAALDALFASNSIAGVMHFAAFAYVGESVADPAKYYRNNAANTLNLLECMRDHETPLCIFSSTCATYGVPEKLPLVESHPQFPINPYGRTKLQVEWMLQDFSHAYGLRHSSLRYFNAAGAAPAEWKAGIGEWHEPETHLIPLVLQAALDDKKEISVFGVDYETPDGSCIRDYIHVCDLADAHVLALERLLAGEANDVYNLGNGRGYSVREVIACARELTGRKIAVKEAPSRPGEPPVLVGDAGKALTELGWRPKFADLESIVQTAWDWEQGRRPTLP